MELKAKKSTNKYEIWSCSQQLFFSSRDFQLVTYYAFLWTGENLMWQIVWNNFSYFYFEQTQKVFTMQLLFSVITLKKINLCYHKRFYNIYYITLYNFEHFFKKEFFVTVLSLTVLWCYMKLFQSKKFLSILALISFPCLGWYLHLPHTPIIHFNIIFSQTHSPFLSLVLCYVVSYSRIRINALINGQKIIFSKIDIKSNSFTLWSKD